MKNLIVFLIFGCIYTTIEVWFHALKYVNEFGFTLIGYTSIFMFFIGGIASLLVGLINERFRIPLIIEMVIGALIITTIELVSGLILKHIGITIWDYSDMIWHYKGVICLEFSFIWFLLIPIIHIVDDCIRYYLNQRK